MLLLWDDFPFWEDLSLKGWCYRFGFLHPFGSWLRAPRPFKCVGIGHFVPLILTGVLSLFVFGNPLPSSTNVNVCSCGVDAISNKNLLAQVSAQCLEFPPTRSLSHVAAPDVESSFASNSFAPKIWCSPC